ncbi:MAG: hypothetical protein J3Q66DRAFT_333183 [Benniella sp.]|nr:MAG: hypothetical protein J3Q66DRAFT_333183 [Benniella sp.]
MIGRTLLSFLVVATIALHSCLAFGIPTGIYRISLSKNEVLSVQDTRVGIPAVLMHPRSTSDPFLQEWLIESRADGTAVIRNCHSRHYLSPRNPKQQQNHDMVIQNQEEFTWRLIRREGRVLIERPSLYPGAPSVVGLAPLFIQPPQVDVQEWKHGDRYQEWNFEPMVESRRRTSWFGRQWRRTSGYPLCEI